MTDKNFRTIVADDHQGNKAVIIVKGNLTDSLITTSKVLNTDQYPGLAHQLKHIVDSASIANTEKVL